MSKVLSKDVVYNFLEEKSIFYGRKQDLDRVEKQTLIAAI